MSDHKPCPFCGSTVISHGGDDKWTGAWCEDCGAMGPNHYSKKEWNDRATNYPEIPEGSVLNRQARMWLKGPLPGQLMADLADILEDDDYSPEKRAHQIVWQALKWMMQQEQTDG